MPSLTSFDDEQSGEDQDGALQIDLGASSSSSATAAISQSSNPSGRFSHFGFFSDGIKFRLNRAVSLGSSRANSVYSAGLSIPNNDAGDCAIIDVDSSLNNVNDTHESAIVENNSPQDVVRNNERGEATFSRYSHRNHLESENAELRYSNRQLGPQEPLEGSLQFSRALSIGRLRDRVLQRASLAEGLFGPVHLEDRSAGSMGHVNGRRLLGGTRRSQSFSTRNNEVLRDPSSSHPYPITGISGMNADHASETSHPRETSNRDLLEHRSAFLERRRRIRPQVRALQRLGSRFESLSGHDRSCILSGQHRTGRCTCRTNNRAANPDDHTSARTSISRIVMLAEALFEVLDEIHQQSVVLSSRPSFSSNGSVPAPKEVVECMPIKVYMKPHKHQIDEAAQCYICLVEYEEGDCIRILPCNHEFHQTCIDKWLKEIHRVCPLCRGNVCRPDTSSTEKLS
ncbi:putative RING finger protein C4G3.12c [Cocos nucifera]|nr:putative RING finger protein C4G3.12c [Cocos nucifera]